MEKRMKLNEVIVSQRKTQNLSQQDLAEKAGVSLNTIKDIELGKVHPSFFTAGKILEALGVKIERIERRPI
jgi:DNA-binding XRE family transcriptional regulator